MSTDLIAYLSYMSNWTGGADNDIQSLIDEHKLFVSLGDFDFDTPINTEFNTLVDLADTVRDETIATDAIQIAADAAALASIYSFGLGMLLFIPLQASVVLDRADISSKSAALNSKLNSVDTDIATLIGPTVSQYITAYKANNDMIKSMAAEGMDGQTCRSILLQFMAQIELGGGTLDVPTFKQYADSARKLYNSQQISAVYDALDQLNLSQKSDNDVTTFVNSIKGFTFDGSTEVAMARVLCVGIMANRMSIATTKLAQNADMAELVGAEAETSVFKMMNCWGKAIVGLAAIASVVDIVLQVLDIVDVVEQTKQMVDALNGQIKTSYQNYYGNMKTAAQQYN
ncbi:uncharacterized protein N0V96_008213 [Colletotrichum fioriniae]|uniref:uncharacterized protein n=1 Tax=Colletotrichum fioriniae TaxID=710243 RepID=UPI0032DB3037|nr:hypothetical protein N0V96_008213 [Colletotrichum fioriniae]